MIEIDLIPTDYRERCQVWNTCRRFAVTLVAVLVVTFGLTGIVHQLSATVEKDVETLQEQQRVSNQHSENLQNLRANAITLTEELAFLEGLSGGLAAEQVFHIVDRALVDTDVWFLSWEFSQVGSTINTKTEPKSVNTGYFLVVPAGVGGDADEAWKIDTHMTIKGQAADYVALSLFARQLLEQPGIRDVRVLNTRLKKYSDMDTIEFNLVVVVNAPKGGGEV